MRIIAIDPGDTQSGYCLMEGYKPISFQKANNEDLLDWISMNASGVDVCAIEMVASYGMAVGKTVFDTCVWVGRFWQKAMDAGCFRVELIYRIEEKTMICHDSRAKDTNIRQALIDRFAAFDRKNGKGTKQKPDWFYGFSKDVWMAYAVGVVYLDKQQETILKRDGTDEIRRLRF